MLRFIKIGAILKIYIFKGGFDVAILKKDQIVLDDLLYRVDLDGVKTGGNGEVYFAKIEDDPQEYAIKLIRKMNKKNKRRFKREVEFCKSKKHNNIIEIISSGEYKGHLYYVMKKYSHTLREVIETENDLSLLMKYVIQLCEAVEFIHDNNVIHRDIKPENILVDNNNRLVLADFGIAHFIDSNVTRATELVANRNYAAPEQKIIGNSKNVTSACDIYALGAIINELFTKNNPLGTEFVIVSDFYPFIGGIDKIVNRCLAQDPIERPSVYTILNEIKFLFDGFIDEIEDAKEYLSPVGEYDFTDKEIDVILEKASYDVLSAKCFYRYKTIDELKLLNTNYHSNIRYNVDTRLKNIYFQCCLYELCKKKFDSEAVVYTSGSLYQNLNLKKQSDLHIYEKIKEIVQNHPVPNEYRYLTGRILKLFSSCCDYHCEELLVSAKKLEDKLGDLDNSPIFYLVYRIKDELDCFEFEDLSIDYYININWETSCVKMVEEHLFNEDIKGKIKKEILAEFRKRWGVTYYKIDEEMYSVKFNNRESYAQFKTFALDFSKDDFVFEGDVLDLISINNIFGDVVELQPINDYDITVVLARIFGMNS